MDNVYWFLVLFSSVVAFLYNRRKIQASYWIWAFILILFSAIRDPYAYRDMPNYVSYFYTGQYETTLTTENVNIGYETVTNLFKIISSSFTLFNTLISIFITTSFAFFCKKESNLPYLSLLLYVLLIYFPSYFILRQYIAVAISLFAFKYIIDQKLTNFLLIALLALSFHTSAIIIFPLYFIYNIPINKYSKFFVFAFAILITASLKVIASQFLSFSEYYSNYLESDYQASSLRLAMKLSYLVLFLYAFGQDAFKKGWNFLILLCIIVENVIYFGSSGIDGVYRLRAYFEVSEILGIPMLLQISKSANVGKSRVIRFSVLVYIILLFVSCYLLLSGGNFEYGYRSIF